MGKSGLCNMVAFERPGLVGFLAVDQLSQG